MLKETSELLRLLENGKFDKTFQVLYPKSAENQRQRYRNAVDQFEKIYGKRQAALFSAPGRTEVGGNHTDHQHGRVLAAAIDLDIICVAALNDDGIVRIKSEGYDQDVIDLSDLSCQASEKNTALSLIRGICARCRELGYQVSGFDAYTTSNVLKGSGLSSSAAFEVAVGTMISHLFNGGGISAVDIAKIGQYAENVYFGKPSGLMDQMASSVGGFITIDFADTEKPVIEPVAFDFAACGHTLCIVDTKGNHADLTGEYAAITVEMKAIASHFEANYLREVEESAFRAKLPALREACGDRAVLRAIHFFGDNARVPLQAEALRSGDFECFKKLVIESGQSSFSRLQNVFACTAPREQGVSLALAVSEDMLAGKGAWRVHGGGFAGTIQAFVPDSLLESYQSAMESLFGQGACYRLSVRPAGGTALLPDLLN